MDNIFEKDPNSYNRSLDPINDYVIQTSIYISKQTGCTFLEAKDFVTKKIQDKSFNKINNPVVVYFEREENGDRVKKKTSLSRYINHVRSNNLILAPSGTVYLSSKNKTSKLSNFIEINTKLRKKVKKQSLVEKAKSNLNLFNSLDMHQTNYKLQSNSVSGTFATQGSILYNPTAHSTLTSTTRTVASFGNAITERCVSGNRHYWSPDIVLYNILSTIQLTDFEQLKETISRYNIYIPSTDDVIKCIKYSSDIYWRDGKKINELKTFIDSLDPIEKAAFIYSGDLFQLKEYNPDLIRSLLTELSKKELMPVEDPWSIMKSMTDTEQNLIHHICYNEVIGCGLDYTLIEKNGHLNILASVCINIRNTISKYGLFISTFFLSNSIPPSVAHLKNMIRKPVLVSDTDSTCATYQDWVIWYFGEMQFSEKSLSIAASVMTITTRSIANGLAILSANLGVDKSMLYRLAMKNEYTWIVMCPTNVSKHYYASTIVREGNVYAKQELEIKGVHLKNSSTAKQVMSSINDIIQRITTDVGNNKLISIKELINEIYDLEQMISKKLIEGDLDFYRHITIKDKEAYKKDEEDSPYSNYLFWKDVFEDKYGPIANPPYLSAKIPIKTSNRTKLNNWIIGIQDEDFKLRLTKWIKDNNKTSLNTLYLPYGFIKANGMIEEVKSVIDVHRVILDLLRAHYLVLESIGIYIKPDTILSDLIN